MYLLYGAWLNTVANITHLCTWPLPLFRDNYYKYYNGCHGCLQEDKHFCTQHTIPLLILHHLNYGLFPAQYSNRCNNINFIWLRATFYLVLMIIKCQYLRVAAKVQCVNMTCNALWQLMQLRSLKLTFQNVSRMCKYGPLTFTIEYFSQWFEQ